MSTENSRMTVVFEIVDIDALKQIYYAHTSGEPIAGAIPRILASGDQVSVPADLVSGLCDIDPDHPNLGDLRLLVTEAERFRDRYRN